MVRPVLSFSYTSNFQCNFSSVTEYFKGDNWRVHPDWVYCEYNSVSDLEKERESSGEYSSRDQEPSFGSPEEQVLHFLARAGRPGWKWMSVSNLSREVALHQGQLFCSGFSVYQLRSHTGSTQVTATTPQYAQWLKRQCTRLKPLWVATPKLSGISQGWALLLRSNPYPELGARRHGHRWPRPEHHGHLQRQGGQAVSFGLQFSIESVTQHGMSRNIKYFFYYLEQKKLLLYPVLLWQNIDLPYISS